MRLSLIARVGSILTLATFLPHYQPAAIEAAPVAQPAAPGRAPMNADRLFDDIAQDEPGFGGMYLDGNTLVVHLLDPANRGRAEQKIRAVLGPDRIPAGGIQARQAQYSFRDLNRWRDRSGAL